MKRIKFRYLAVIVVLMHFSCDSSRILDSNVEIPSAKWSISDKKEFNFVIEDTLSNYNVFVNIRNSNDYQYRNLYLYMEMTSPSNKFFRDTVEVMLAESDGRWKGKGVGSLWQSQIPILKGVKMLESGQYNISMVHGMRHDTLKAITDVGIRVEIDEQ